MSDYTRVVSLRISSDLLEGVRERARAEGRSVSGEIVYLVREQVEARAPAGPPKKITGWLEHRPVPGTYAEFRQGRDAASRQLAEAVRRKAKTNTKAKSR